MLPYLHRLMQYKIVKSRRLWIYNMTTHVKLVLLILKINLNRTIINTGAITVVEVNNDKIFP